MEDIDKMLRGETGDEQDSQATPGWPDQPLRDMLDLEQFIKDNTSITNEDTAISQFSWMYVCAAQRRQET